MSFSNPIVGGEGGELVRASIKSPDYVPNTSGWIVRRDGSAEFNDIVIRGGAFVGGDIIIGPAGMPQVHIGSDANRGFVEFPTNNVNETAPGYIAGQDNDGGPFFNLSTRIESPAVAGGQKSYALFNSASTTGISPPSISFGIGPSGGIVNKLIIGDALISAFEEILVGVQTNARNHPNRVIGGRVNGPTVTTTISKTVNTQISNAASQNITLENGVAYKVDVQIQSNASSGTGAAGTQGNIWRLWDGTVATGTTLGAPVETYNAAVGTASGAEQFSFIFTYSGTTGNKTLNLSALNFTGTDTRVAIINTRYMMIINRIGLPARVQNL